MLEALESAELIAPSNPYVSIRPILAVEPIRAALERRQVLRRGEGPLIGGRAVKAIDQVCTSRRVDPATLQVATRR